MSEDTTRAPCNAIQRDNPPFRLPSSSAEHVEKFWVVCARQKSNATDQLRTSHSMKSAVHAGVRILDLLCVAVMRRRSSTFVTHGFSSQGGIRFPRPAFEEDEI